jgi:acyl-coenzyme A synthetase/AMP-(fatty) acid ligase
VVTPTDRLTYAEAEQSSAYIAGWLLSQGVGTGSRVGLFFANGAEWVLWWLAVTRIGALAGTGRLESTKRPCRERSSWPSRQARP